MDKLKHWVKNVTQWLGLSIFDPKLSEGTKEWAMDKQTDGRTLKVMH